MANPTAFQILQNFYAAETAFMSSQGPDRDPAPMLAVLSPNFQVQQSPDLPWGGEYTGHKGFLEWTQQMSGFFENLEVLEPKVFENGELGDEVVVSSRLKLTRKGGEVWERRLVQTVVVDRALGVIVEITPFYWDVAGLKTFLGL